MISVRLGTPLGAQHGPVGVLVYPVSADLPEPAPWSSPAEVAAEVAAFAAEVDDAGRPGRVATLPRPLRDPSRVLLVGVGAGDERGWRKAGAAIARAARDAVVSLQPPADFSEAALRGLAEGVWLGQYGFRIRDDKPGEAVKLQELVVLAAASPELERALETARVVAEHINFARDLTNTPSLTKTPSWFVEQVGGRDLPPGVSLTVREPAELAEEGFGGILAVGGGSARGPRLLEISYRPPTETAEHVVLIGKGITFDTGGIDIKPNDAMQLMRKDMGGAATVVAATLAAARLSLGVRITALTPLAENMLSGSSWRSGDVVRHYGGLTSEVHSTDAEGRVVLADALAYAVSKLEPSVLIDLGTLTGASRVALGKTTAALFSENDELAKALQDASIAAGESVWRMPLADEYMKEVAAEIADLNNAAGNPGAITAALYLREFAGPMRDRWAHIDMSAPSWSGENDGDVRKGATGWGVRTLVRWLSHLS
ncbi:leucyl aminopeptidase family protein [Allorhizocola rhizosphaerae]|uniref:leucyl aminopeptidase family protein n=1 Tax=Allorhizocola rhizosphaerae TaxID=1872709 RepID=UPI000E3EAA6B|nr:leucyl aminopeptidase family protein [Allorhizocola rhizosphaerae]